MVSSPKYGDTFFCLFPQKSGLVCLCFIEIFYLFVFSTDLMQNCIIALNILWEAVCFIPPIFFWKSPKRWGTVFTIIWTVPCSSVCSLMFHVGVLLKFLNKLATFLVAQQLFSKNAPIILIGRVKSRNIMCSVKIISTCFH